MFRAFVIGGIAAIGAFFAIAVVATAAGGRAWINVGGGIGLFVVGGLLGMLFRGVFARGVRRGRAEAGLVIGEPLRTVPAGPKLDAGSSAVMYEPGEQLAHEDMTEEMRIIDQLATSELPLPRIVGGFGSVDRAKHAILGYCGDGMIEVLDARGTPLSAQRVVQLCALVDGWSDAIAMLRVRLTDGGLMKFG
jgi:hypothetical protein